MTPTFDPSTQLGYLETIGRVSGQPRETEIWFGYEANTIYILSGGGLDKDWVKNARGQPNVRFRIGDTWLNGTLRLVTDAAEDARVRRVVAGKYYDIDPDGDDPLPNEWSQTATPVAIDLDER
ncbi:MAG TPA: nitroreductase family deazaflavin-dependent oxidoreductase [Thermomicrobiales bacterium]|nr:nitroreductase family deazaflavin-dependent oxidoreductase [Thermomicrobiales bacterium]